MKSRAEDPDWVRAEYERQMGAEALARQTAAKNEKGAAVECECGWKGLRAARLGPHHSQACPLFQVEPET